MTVSAWACARVITPHGASPCPVPSWWTPLHIAAVLAVLAGVLTFAVLIWRCRS